MRYLLVTTAIAGSLLAPSFAVAGDELTVVSWGGAYSESQRKAFYEPYNAAGNKITEAEYNGEVAKIKAMVEANAVTWDVIDVDTPTGMQACAEGALETIDWGKLGLDKSKFIGGDLLDCAVPNIVYGTVFGYDTSKMKDGPTVIGDLFDTAKFPGKRGLWKNPTVNLEWALIADGVPAADVYKVLGTPEGVDRAFKKLDTIKADIVWWEAGAQAPQLLADGQVAMTSAWNGRSAGRNRQGWQAIQDCLGSPGPGLGLVGNHQGHAEARRRLSLRGLRISARGNGRADQAHRLWPVEQGCNSKRRSKNAAQLANSARQLENRLQR